MAGWAGQIADRFSKSKVLIVTKSFEILTMIFALFALQATSMPMLLGVLFLLAAQANFFSPAKYGILPEILPEADLSRANALLELTTFVAIVIGGGFGTLLFEHWKHEQWKMSAFLIALAVIGSLISLGIPKVKPSPSTEPFHWNPFAEIVHGFGILRKDRAMALTVAGISFFWFFGGLIQLNLVDPEGILPHCILLKLKFRNEYYARLFLKRLQSVVTFDETTILLKPVADPFAITPSSKTFGIYDIVWMPFFSMFFPYLVGLKPSSTLSPTTGAFWISVTVSIIAIAVLKFVAASLEKR